MSNFRCIECGYVYDPADGDSDNDVEPGTSFEDLPVEWACPGCGARQETFEPLD